MSISRALENVWKSDWTEDRAKRSRMNVQIEYQPKLVIEENTKRRLAPPNFSPNYKQFDQLLQTVKNETAVLNLVLKSFLQISILSLISTFMRKRISRFKYFVSQCRKNP